ncbi:MAG: hypothetical protein J4415_01005 [Candidatus Diapherotrites archaeon]|uniref:DNA-binding protein n=1 Tax=Candidatus Iainarchaeum sp. TaxID=3101447 RepID=A0A8T4KSY7_9ARCH|nr:hypothetical protein [Candidatus Diapherotrites archaeon]
MEDLDIEELKRRKMEEMKQKFAGQEATEQHAAFAAQEQEAQLDAIMRKLLEPEAKARLANVRLVNKDLYFRAVQSVMYLAQQSGGKEKLNDYQVKRILERLSGAKREIRIVKKGKKW